MTGPMLRDVGEAGLLKALQPILQRHTAGLPLGTGDDVAVTPDRLVWTIDSMIEGTHFRWYEECSARDVAVKLVASNISDLASKGARPLYVMISLGLPSETPMSRIEEFYAGLDEAARLYDVKILGGDTVAAPQWCLTLVAVGQLDEGAPIAARSNAKPGMNVFVTGAPGESAAGFHLLNSAAIVDQWLRARLTRKHLAPAAQVAAGRALITNFSEIAMIDVSDGVAKDAGEIARLSGVAIVLDHGALQESADLQAAAAALGRDPRELLLHGGEDYELLFCVRAELPEVRAALASTGTIVHQIGRVEPGEGVWLARNLTEREPLTPQGFQHFTPR